MPSSLAVSHTFLGPTSMASWAYTELSDYSVARTRFIVPP